MHAHQPMYAHHKTLANTLIEWYDAHGRDLPWRNTRDPYKILVSEIMLQQTQVHRVIEKYHTWLDTFPDWQALAAASPAQVITHWAGLGYNRRALALHNIAKHIVTHGEPQQQSEWITLKGIGPYTSAAVATFAHHERVLPIDTNIRRVLGRVLLRIHFPQLQDDPNIAQQATPLLHAHTRFYDIPQAIFDLSAKYCTAKSPDCASCPLKTLCASSEDVLQGRMNTPKRTIQRSTEYVREGKRYPNRIYRGRILAQVRTAHLQHKPITRHMLGGAIDPHFDPIQDQEWIDELVDKLIHDQLIVEHNAQLSLPT